MSHPNQPSRKGKEVISECRAPKQSRTSYVPRPLTGFSIHEPLNTPVFSSSDEDDGHTEFRTPAEFQSNLTNNVILRGEGSNGTVYVNDVMGSSSTVMEDQRQPTANVSEERNRARRERDRGRRNSLTAEQKEENNARRRAARQNKALTAEQKEEINASRRAAWQNKVLTTEQKEDINASRRAARKNKALDERNARQRAKRQNMSAEERQEMNANIRAHMQSLPRQRRKALLAKRKETDVARRNTPCTESIAMPCPNAYASVNLAKVGAASPPASPLGSTPDYTIGSNDDMEAFLSGLTDENAVPDDLMDEEYCLYATEGRNREDILA